MKTLTMQLIAALAVASALPAQTKTVVYPLDHTNREGSSYNYYYHVTNGVCRIQYSYEDWNLALPKGAMISQFGYRQDAGFAVSTLKIQFEALMGHNSLAQENLSSKFTSNYDDTPTTVIAKKIFDLPAMSKPTVAPATTFLLLKLDSPFAYQHPKNLVTEIKVYSNSNSNKAFAYYMDHASYYSPTLNFGMACKTSGKIMPLLSSGTAVLGQSWRLSMSSFPASSGTLLILGASKTRLLGVLDLPLKLDFLGMPGCLQHVDINIFMPGPATNTGGGGSASFKVPLNFRLVGKKIYAQMWAADIFANPTGMVTSNGTQVQFGAYPREQMLFYADNTTNTTGSRYLNYGQVTRFDYK